MILNTIRTSALVGEVEDLKVGYFAVLLVGNAKGIISKCGDSALVKPNHYS